MKTKLIIATVAVLACTGIAMAESDGDGDGPIKDKKQLREQLKDCDPALEQDCTKLKECLPEEVQEAVKDMTQARKQYQQQLLEKKKQGAGDCTSEECDQLRERLREQLEEQVCDRQQLRERLQEMRECLQEEVAEQTQEQVRVRRGGS